MLRDRLYTVSFII